MMFSHIGIVLCCSLIGSFLKFLFQQQRQESHEKVSLDFLSALMAQF